LENKKLSQREIMFYVENSNSKSKEAIKSHFAMRHNILSEDSSTYDVEEKRALSRWVEECPELRDVFEIH